MFTAAFGPDHRQPSGRDFDRSSVCPFPPARQPVALGIIYRDRRSLWLDPRGFALHHRRGAHACQLQLGSFSLGQVVISRGSEHSEWIIEIFLVTVEAATLVLRYFFGFF